MTDKAERDAAKRTIQAIADAIGRPDSTDLVNDVKALVAERDKLRDGYRAMRA